MIFTVLRKNKIIAIVVFLLMLSGIALYFILSWPGSPEAEMKKARESISFARSNDAEKYAPEMWQKATALYDSALLVWQNENQRFVTLRDYSKVVSFAQKAGLAAAGANEAAIKRAYQAHHNIREILLYLENEIGKFDKVYLPLPLPESTRKTYNEAKMLLAEVKVAKEKGEIHIAEQKIKHAEEKFTKVAKQTNQFLESYFEAYPRWAEMVEAAIAQTQKQKSVAVIVDKLARLCHLYQNGRQVHSFQAEFGPNWIGDKQHRGDNATPEGVYHVVQKKDRRKTIYYKALLLNYPNNEDKIRYNQNVKSGKIPARLEVGGLIEIHGHGGQGFNWTKGCVALADKDMDIVYRYCDEKTPVIIVGSMVALQNWIEHEMEK